jgi:hypothetical protein
MSIYNHVIPAGAAKNFMFKTKIIRCPRCSVTKIAKKPQARCATCHIARARAHERGKRCRERTPATSQPPLLVICVTGNQGETQQCNAMQCNAILIRETPHSRCNRLSSRVDLFTRCRFESLRDDNIRPEEPRGLESRGEPNPVLRTADGNCVDGTVLGPLLAFAVLLIFCMAPACPG